MVKEEDLFIDRIGEGRRVSNEYMMAIHGNCFMKQDIYNMEIKSCGNLLLENIPTQLHLLRKEAKTSELSKRFEDLVLSREYWVLGRLLHFGDIFLKPHFHKIMKAN